jgi:hypothetical protein
LARVKMGGEGQVPVTLLLPGGQYWLERVQQ